VAPFDRADVRQVRGGIGIALGVAGDDADVVDPPRGIIGHHRIADLHLVKESVELPAGAEDLQVAEMRAAFPHCGIEMLWRLGIVEARGGIAPAEVDDAALEQLLRITPARAADHPHGGSLQFIFPPNLPRKGSKKPGAVSRPGANRQSSEILGASFNDLSNHSVNSVG
jgi:hypothetical protein